MDVEPPLIANPFVLPPAVPSGNLDAPARGRRRGKGWERVSHGIHKPTGATSDLPAWQLALPGSGRFTHLTGAALHGWWLPPLPPGLPVMAAMSELESRPVRAGLRVTRHRRLADPVVVDRVPCDPPAEILVACARDLSVLDLLVLAESAVHTGSCTRAEIAAAAAHRRRGAPRLRQALALCDGRAESPWEVLLRTLHRVSGIVVEPQYELRDEHGAFIARADLWVVGTNAIHEYDGGVHLERGQQRADLRRARRIGNEAWVRRGYTSVDVLHQAAGIVRDAELSLGREHRPSAVRTWHQLLAESAFTPRGRSRLAARLIGRT